MKRISVVTGGAGGMGLAAAKLLGADHYVVICDVDQQRLDTALAELVEMGIQCQGVVCDITDQKSVNELVTGAARLGTIASVIHAAGLSPQMAPPEVIMRVNALGTMNICEAFYAIAEPGFCIVNVASMAGHLLPRWLIPTRSYGYADTDAVTFFNKMMRICKLFPKKLRAGQAYALSKNFVIWYSKTQAAKFGCKEARILSVSPGTIDTDMGRLEEKSGAAELIKFAALKRYGLAEEVAQLLAFCASDNASFITGVDIPCDGGVIASITPKQLRSLSR